MKTEKEIIEELARWKEEEPHQLKPFDKILYRYSKDSFWRGVFFSHTYNGCHYVTGSGFATFVIPYKGNEDKLGKAS